MKLTPENAKNIQSVSLPAIHEINEKTPFGLLFRLLSSPRSIPCNLEVLSSALTYVTSVRVVTESSTFTIGKRPTDDLFSDRNAPHLDCREMSYDGSTLKLKGIGVWTEHPQLVGENNTQASRVLESWSDSLKLIEEVRSDAGSIIRPGLRPPQVGALHAVAAFRTVSERPGLIVMPTGTGKTEVMIAAMLTMRPRRLLILVPTDALRDQAATKFSKLGVLPNTGTLRSDLAKPVLNPVIAVINHCPPDDEGWGGIERANVAIATVAVLQGLNKTRLKKFAKHFDTLFFDEAHHIKASSWEVIYETVEAESNVLMFTATPFRLDGLRLPGRIIFDFPLRLAQKQGYFRKIRLAEVWEYGDQSRADEAIAAKAVEQLRKDKEDEFQHIVMARANTQDRAEQLYNEIYSAKYADLNPVVIHSNTKGRKEIERAILAGEHSIVVCVDLFGEGFDLPNFKIAALHDRHQSLGVTLQFVGRFTRDASNIGDPTLVANLADADISDSVESLYAENADWNQLIPELSSRAIESQLNFSDFLERMERPSAFGDQTFGLNVLRPKMSALVYRNATSFSPHRFRKNIKRSEKLVDHWTSRDRDMVVFITKASSPIEWAEVKDENNSIWHIYIAAHDPQRNLLFIYSSAKGTVHHDLAEWLCGSEAQLIEGDQVFRAFDGIERLTFHNVGLHYRSSSKQRFRMSTGLDVSEAISPIEQRQASKCNLFAVGFQNGEKTSIGASAKGRIWSMRSCSIPDWRAWCMGVATKLLDESIETNSFLKHTLIPREVSSLPSTSVLAVFMPHQWYGEMMEVAQVLLDGKKMDFHGFGILSYHVASEICLVVDMGWDEATEVSINLEWGPNNGDFRVTQTKGITVEIQINSSRCRFDAFLRENPPTLLFPNGSEVTGGHSRAPHIDLQPSFDVGSIEVISWLDTNIELESKWKNGDCRAKTIQGMVINALVNGDALVVYDDDDPGEAADVVEIIELEGQLVFRLYHCKFSSGPRPSGRLKDLETVCSQAVQSAATWASNPDAMLDHLQAREQPSRLRGRSTRFEKGDLKTLTRVRRLLKKHRHRFELIVVQPGLSRRECDAELASMLASADMFVCQVTSSRLRVWGSA